MSRPSWARELIKENRRMVEVRSIKARHHAARQRSATPPRRFRNIKIPTFFGVLDQFPRKKADFLLDILKGKGRVATVNSLQPPHKP